MLAVSRPSRGCAVRPELGLERFLATVAIPVDNSLRTTKSPSLPPNPAQQTRTSSPNYELPSHHEMVIVKMHGRPPSPGASRPMEPQEPADDLHRHFRQSSFEIIALHRVGGQGQSLAVGVAGFGAAAQAAQQVGSRGVE